MISCMDYIFRKKKTTNFHANKLKTIERKFTKRLPNHAFTRSPLFSDFSDFQCFTKMYVNIY